MPNIVTGVRFWISMDCSRWPCSINIIHYYCFVADVDISFLFLFPCVIPTLRYFPSGDIFLVLPEHFGYYVICPCVLFEPSVLSGLLWHHACWGRRQCIITPRWEWKLRFPTWLVWQSRRESCLLTSSQGEIQASPLDLCWHYYNSLCRRQ